MARKKKKSITKYFVKVTQANTLRGMAIILIAALILIQVLAWLLGRWVDPVNVGPGFLLLFIGGVTIFSYVLMDKPPHWTGKDTTMLVMVFLFQLVFFKWIAPTLLPDMFGQAMATLSSMLGLP